MNSIECLPALSRKSVIHPTAIIAPGAIISENVSIGPYSIIGEHVEIGSGTIIGAHVTIDGWTRIGENNQIGIGAVIGTTPQDQKYRGEHSELMIGNNNIIREYVTIESGTEGGGGITSIDHHNVILVSTHIAHDVKIGNHNTLSKSVGVAGHVVIEDWVTIGAMSGVHQFVKIGSLSMIRAFSGVSKDVAPYTLVAGLPAKSYGLNIERLRRNGFSAKTRSEIKRAYHILFQKGLKLDQAIAILREEFPDHPDVKNMIDFSLHSSRGICREFKE